MKDYCPPCAAFLFAGKVNKRLAAKRCPRLNPIPFHHPKVKCRLCDKWTNNPIPATGMPNIYFCSLRCLLGYLNTLEYNVAGMPK